ncbi:MAG: F0F1 ATP synthase subunit A [Ignavibacterium sp.]
MDSLTTQVIVDSLKNTHSESGGSWILHHVMDGNYLDFTPFGKIYLPHLEIFGFDISITRHVVFMWLAAILITYVFIKIAKSYQNSLVPKGSTNFWEVFIVFVRDEIAKPTIGKGYERFLPYLLTAFFFILFGNFLGLIPFSATFTSNIAVTATLATMSFLVIQLGGIKNNGFLGYFKGLIPHGVPVFLLPIMVVVELLGLFTKPFALAIRLFANMTAGHIVIYALISLIFVMQSYLISPVSVGMALFIYGLEVLVALLQAYIFTMLSSLFIGMAVHQEH